MRSCPRPPLLPLLSYTFTGHSELRNACNDLKVSEAWPQKVTVFSSSQICRPGVPELRRLYSKFSGQAPSWFYVIQLPLVNRSLLPYLFEWELELQVNPESDSTLSTVGSSYPEQTPPPRHQASWPSKYWAGSGGPLQWFSPMSPHKYLQQLA